MSLLNYIPVVAHIKAATHWVFNDNEGAKKTMDTFHTKTPIVAHLTAGVAKLAGKDDLAKECWNGGNSSLNAIPVIGHVKGVGHLCIGDVEGCTTAMKDSTNTTLAIADGIPVVGHAKAVVHYALGDKKGGNRAMKAASRTTVVMSAGAGGFLLGGPVGAVAGGVGVGAEWDLVVAAASHGKDVNGFAKIINDPKSVDSYFDAGLSIVGDGMAGYSGGKLAQKITSPGGQPQNTAAGGSAATSSGTEAQAAAAEQIASDYQAGKISFEEYTRR